MNVPQAFVQYVKGKREMTKVTAILLYGKDEFYDVKKWMDSHDFHDIVVQENVFGTTNTDAVIIHNYPDNIALPGFGHLFTERLEI